jgi:DNA primase
MAFPPRFLDELRTRLTCSEVVGRRVRLVKKGREYSGLCPFHNEKSPSFFVNDQKGFFHCFGCGAHGDVIGFAMRIDNLAFPEAVEKLAGEAGLEVPRLSRAEVEREERAKTLADAVEAAAKWFEAQLRAPAGRAAREYLERRGLSAATIARFRLGFAPDGWQGLRAELTRQGYSDAQLLEASLAAISEHGKEPFDFFRNRVIFPICDRRGRVIAFGGRVLDDSKPKYLNSRDTPLFDKSRNLYALDQAREGVRQGQSLIVAEGYMDVIALHAAGFTGAVAPLGTALTEGQIEMAWRLTPEPILCLDGDEAGRRAAQRAAERALPLLKPGTTLRFAALPEGDDPDSLIRARGAVAMGEILRQARPLSDIVWDGLAAGRGFETPERRALLLKSIEDTARRIADQEIARQYAASLRSRAWQMFRGAVQGQRAEPALRGAHQPQPRDLLAPRIALRAALNHPGVLAEADIIGDFERLVVADEALDRLRHDLIHAVGDDASLSAEALRTRLLAEGHGTTLLALAAPDPVGHGRFVDAAASEEEVRIGLRALFDGLHRATLRQELEAAQADLAEEPTAEKWERFQLLRQLAAGEEAEAELIDQFDEARRRS